MLARLLAGLLARLLARWVACSPVASAWLQLWSPVKGPLQRSLRLPWQHACTGVPGVDAEHEKRSNAAVLCELAAAAEQGSAGRQRAR